MATFQGTQTRGQPNVAIFAGFQPEVRGFGSFGSRPPAFGSFDPQVRGFGATSLADQGLVSDDTPPTDYSGYIKSGMSILDKALSYLGSGQTQQPMQPVVNAGGGGAPPNTIYLQGPAAAPAGLPSWVLPAAGVGLVGLLAYVVMQRKGRR